MSERARQWWRRRQQDREAEAYAAQVRALGNPCDSDDPFGSMTDEPAETGSKGDRDDA